METTYSSIIQKKNSQIFFEKLLSNLSEKATKYFGETLSDQIIKNLTEGEINLINSENFLFSENALNDNSLQILKSNPTSEPLEFIWKCIADFKKKAEQGNSCIEIREFFIALSNFEVPKDTLELNLKLFLTSLSNSTNSSPFKIVLLNPYIIRNIEDAVERNYSACFDTMLKAYKEMKKSQLNIPSLELMIPIYEDYRYHQEKYLARIFSLPNCKSWRRIPELSHITSLEEDTKELREALKKLSKNKSIEQYNLESMLLELKRLKKKNPLRTYASKSEMLVSSYSHNEVNNDYSVNISYTYLPSFLKTFNPYTCHIEINCEDLSKNEMEPLIGVAKNLGLLKLYYFSEKEIKIPNNYQIRLTLKGIKDTSVEFVKFIKNKVRQFTSNSNKNFLIEIEYEPSCVYIHRDKFEPKYIRVISDVHADYNKSTGHEYTFNFEDDFVVNCGDTAGSSTESINWLKVHIPRGLTVAGNHLGYSPSHPELPLNDVKNTKNEQVVELGKMNKNACRFISNSTMEAYGLLILGTTLFTDFALYGEDHIEESMKYAQSYMNDFKLCKVKGHRIYTVNEGKWNAEYIKHSNREVRTFTPQDHAYFFHYSLDFLTRKVKKNKDKNIIIVTHHAPSPYSISKEYIGSKLNPAFASNLNKFIIENPNIRLWCHGHVHNPCDYILGETRIVCCPFGYCNENNFELPYNYGLRIKLEDIKSKKSWKEICKREIENSIIKVYNN